MTPLAVAAVLALVLLPALGRTQDGAAALAILCAFGLPFLAFAILLD